MTSDAPGARLPLGLPRPPALTSAATPRGRSLPASSPRPVPSLTRHVRAGSQAAIALTILAALAADALGWSTAAVQLPLVLLALIVTLPHGAADAAAPYLRSMRLRIRTYALLGLVYVTLAAATWLVARSLPLLGLSLLLVMSVVHFGAGEAEFHRATDTPAPTGWWLVSGLVVVVLPLAAHAREAGGWLVQIVPAWRASPPLGIPPSALGVLAAVAAIAIGAAAILASLRAWHLGRRVPALELALLTTCAVVAPPVVTIAVYLAVWHSMRHLSLLGQDAAYARRPLLPLGLAAVSMTVGALGILIALVYVVGSPGDLASVLREQIWLLIALTVPHGVVVAWLDRTRPRGA